MIGAVQIAGEVAWGISAPMPDVVFPGWLERATGGNVGGHIGHRRRHHDLGLTGHMFIICAWSRTADRNGRLN